MKRDTAREANTTEVVALRQENTELKQLVAELSLQNRTLKKSLNAEEWSGFPSSGADS